MFNKDGDVKVYLEGIVGPVGYYRPLDPHLHGSDGFESFTVEDVSLGMHDAEEEARVHIRKHYSQSLRKFTPTHEFLGMELMILKGNTNAPPGTMGLYRDEEGYRYQIPDAKVEAIPDFPKPGEVWKYVGLESDARPLRFVDGDGSLWGAGLFDYIGGGMGFTRKTQGGRFCRSDLSNYVKILNADGSPVDA